MSTLESDAVQVDSVLRLKNESILNLVGSHNDVDLWGGGPHTSRVEVDLVGGSGATITGIIAGTEGDLLFLWNGGGGTVPEDTLTLVNNSPASAAANRIWIADGKSLNIPNNDGVLLIYIGGFGWTVFGGATTMIRAQELSLDPSTTPAALANGSTTNDYNPFAGLLFTSYVKQDTGLASTITGITAAGAPNSEGRILVFQNISTTGTITIKNNDPASAADNRILCPGNADLVIGPLDTAMLIYDDAAAMWRVVNTTGGGASVASTPPFIYTATGFENPNGFPVPFPSGMRPGGNTNYVATVTMAGVHVFLSLDAPAASYAGDHIVVETSTQIELGDKLSVVINDL